MREDRAIGTIALWRMEAPAFSDKQIALVKTFADQAAIAIENVRLFNETKEALEQQTAVAEILRVISGSPTDVTTGARRDCRARRATVRCRVGIDVPDRWRHLAPSRLEGAFAGSGDHGRYALPINRDSVSGRALLERKSIQVRDMLAEGAEYPLSHDLAQQFGHRTVVVMPLYREGQPFGTILLRRNEVRPFDERELALLQTFGDQAAIAIENVRLFNETKEALDQQRASGEVLAAISSSIADTTPVFDKILESCERLFAGKIAGINLVGDDGLLHIARVPRPGQGRARARLPACRGRPKRVRIGDRDRTVVHYPDVATAKACPKRPARLARQSATRA